MRRDACRGRDVLGQKERKTEVFLIVIGKIANCVSKHHIRAMEPRRGAKGVDRKKARFGRLGKSCSMEGQDTDL